MGVFLAIAHPFAKSPDGKGLVQPEQPLGNLAVVGVGFDPRRHRGPKSLGQCGVGWIVGGESIGVGSLNHEDHRGPVAGLDDGLQRAEVFGAPDSGGDPETARLRSPLA